MSGNYALGLFEDRLPAAGRLRLPAGNRVLYVRQGAVEVTKSAGAAARVAEGQAWYGAVACEVAASESGTAVLRYELSQGAAPGGGDAKVLLEHVIDLDPRAEYLMRADRVDFAPGGVALPHRHRGGGIRCLLQGALEVTVGEGAPRAVAPGEAWFESGREPVRAVAAPQETSFIRFSVLPAAIRGQSSILYVDPAAAATGRPRRYTVYVDEPITL